MPLIVLDLTSAPQSLLGTLSRRLIEVRSGLFVGAASRRSTEALWQQVIEAGPRSAVLVYGARNELGIGLRTYGTSRFRALESDGLPLVGFVTSRPGDAALHNVSGHGSLA